MENKIKNRHYTSVEKKIFLEILKKYKNVIEIKKSDLTTLKDKELAWAEIVKEYNLSASVTQERTTQQLKKLWTNLKQMQRDALTKEKQARYATGGGPESDRATIDPDVACIIPNLLPTAPVIFSCNMTEGTVDRKRKEVFYAEDFQEIACEGEINMENCGSESADEPASVELLAETSNLEKCEIVDGPAHSESIAKATCSSYKSITPSHRKKKQRKSGSIDASDDERELRLQRIRLIIREENTLAEMRKKHEETLHKLAVEKCEFEIRAAKAKAELAELLLEKEKNKNI